MTPEISRRSFLKTTGLAGLAAVTAKTLFAEEAKPAGAPINIAFVGVAHIHTPEFIGVLKKRADFKVKAVWDHDAKRAEKRAQELDSRVETDLEKIWTDETIKAVVICSETNRHGPLVVAAAKAGKHMFVEKPLGFSAQESFAMAKAINERKLLFQTGYFMRSDAKFIFLKEEIASGRFGKITRIRGSNCHSGALGGWFDGEWRWMADPAQAGVGGFGDLGTHKLDILLWLMGEVSEVTADIQTVTNRYPGCDESGEALLHFRSGAIGTLAASWVDIDDPVDLQICGTEAHAIIRGGKLYYRNAKQGRRRLDEVEKLPGDLPRPLPLFLDAVAGKKVETLVTASEAAYRVSVMEAMYRGAKDKTWVAPVNKW